MTDETKTVMFSCRNTISGKKNYFAVDNVASRADAFRLRQIFANRADAQGLPYVYSWFLATEEAAQQPA